MNISAFAIALLALIGLVGIAEQWLPAGSFWWRVLLALWILGLLYERLQTRRLSLSTDLSGPGRLYLGRSERITLSFRHAHSRSLALRYVLNLPQTISGPLETQPLTLAPEEVTEHSYSLQATEHAEPVWSHLVAKVRGPLGLAWWPLDLPLDQGLQVVPDMAGSRGAVLANTPAGGRASKPGSGTELHHLREYAPGDPRQMIDWKSSAKLNKLVTRVRSEEQSLQIMLVLDVGRTAGTRIDGLSQLGHYVNLCSRFAQQAVLQGDQIGLVVAAHETLQVLPPAAGVQGAHRVRQVLGGLSTLAVETDLLSAALQADRLARNRSLVLLLTDLYGQSLAGNFGRSLKLWQRRHLPVVVSLLSAEVATLPRLEAVNERDVYRSLASQEYQRAVSRTALGAGRLGARTIVAQPREVEARVYQQYLQLKQRRRV